MPDANPARIVVRFPPYSSPSWQERCLRSLAAAGHVEVTPVFGPTLPGPVDLIVDLSGDRVDPSQLTAPRLAYWSFVYGDEPERIAPGLQEYVAGGRAAYARLVRLDSLDRGTVLKEGSVKTVGPSLGATRRRLLEAIVDWPGQLLKEALEEKTVAELPTVRLRRRGAVSHVLLRIALPAAWLRNVLQRAAQKVTREHWAVGVIDAPVQQVCQSFDPDKIRWLPAPPDGFLADPFGVMHADGTLTPREEIFGFTTHASYPQLIEHDGAIYCIPETLAQRRVQLFRATAFPYRWVADTVLLENFAGADATVCRHEDRWWLFVGNHDDQDEAKLFIFHAADLRGPWLPHAANPVKCDLRSARPAGPLFRLDGALYRPAQDCSVTYGGAVVLNRIDRLTPEHFSERPVRRLAPATKGPYPHGLHTLSGAGNLTLVDGKRHVVAATFLTAPWNRLTEHLNRRLDRKNRVA